MSFIDVLFGVLLCYALYKGVKNGLFIELASLIALLAGIFVALKFSDYLKAYVEKNVSWDAKYIEITAFALTFIAVILLIHLSAKLLTKIADFAFLGWLNKLVGGLFSVIKTLLVLSVLILIFEKINTNNRIASKEQLNNSTLYPVVKQIAGIIYPKIEQWYSINFDTPNTK
ncbi:CvpA family protein [uncultured Flavobacterium sp.]|uniref:CvpA family protein n=1 Tax=uncultured Flavobacterium sp. TaxID=165435 RepID=UPI0030CA55A7|tara:strand:- start:4144 stop:4659 length:516 start_codon:yes stop_codon:yes gene_type:complete